MMERHSDDFEPLYDGSIYDRRTAIEDPQQADHVRRKSWLKPGDCTCRRDDQGRYFNVCVNANCSIWLDSTRICP